MPDNPDRPDYEPLDGEAGLYGEPFDRLRSSYGAAVDALQDLLWQAEEAVKAISGIPPASDAAAHERESAIAFLLRLADVRTTGAWTDSILRRAADDIRAGRHLLAGKP